ncbi:MAG: DJ-1/PfpI family protein [Candidatus Dependentiae bacterium ADurb.Bin331]|nr:MAG: DJ-1/PfpI family protein [Candidatus Dependentiae bacterium ADurb.Bin331]
MNVVHDKKVVLIVASEGYQPLEYEITKNELEAEGIEVLTASDRAGGAVASDGSTTPVDLTIDQLNIGSYDGIFFIGGSGALDCLDHSTSYHLIAQAKDRKIPYGAICISTRILAKAGGLTGKKATGWDGDHALSVIYKLNGVTYEEGKEMVTDEYVVTASGPKSAKEFAQGIIRLLTIETLS